MNYQKHYDILVDRARNRQLNGYFENHHVLPKCLGGSNQSANLVRLTPEEHYIAHLLLVKIYKHKDTASYKKMLHACNLMSGKSNIGRKNKSYGWVRRELSKLTTGRKHSKEVRLKISEKVKTYYRNNSSHLKGKPLSEEQRRKASNALKGRIFTQEHKDKISLSLKGKEKPKSHKEKYQGENNPSFKFVDIETQRKICNDFLEGLSNKSLQVRYNFSELKIIKILNENNIDHSKRTCPHCLKSGSASNMLRWHFEKCKMV